MVEIITGQNTILDFLIYINIIMQCCCQYRDSYSLIVFFFFFFFCVCFNNFLILGLDFQIYNLIDYFMYDFLSWFRSYFIYSHNVLYIFIYNQYNMYAGSYIRNITTIKELQKISYDQLILLKELGTLFVKISLFIRLFSSINYELP